MQQCSRRLAFREWRRMQKPSDKLTQNGGLIPEFDIQPRVYVRKLGGEYVEIVGIKSFERNDHDGSDGRILFVMDDKQNDVVKNILTADDSNFVDVKMEFLIGLLMVMSFSGFVDAVSDNSVSFGLSTPITTDVLSGTETLH
jgi:hypothetical protein